MLNLEKLKENLEVFTLAVTFFVSILALTPTLV